MSEPLVLLINRAVVGYLALAAIGETVEDEWQYVADLSSAWRARLLNVAAARSAEVADDALVAAVDRALDEIGRIDDPHRAIDWLSTFPQVVLLALGAEDRPSATPAR